MLLLDSQSCITEKYLFGVNCFPSYLSQYHYYSIQIKRLKCQICSVSSIDANYIQVIQLEKTCVIYNINKLHTNK